MEIKVKLVNEVSHYLIVCEDFIENISECFVLLQSLQ